MKGMSLIVLTAAVLLMPAAAAAGEPERTDKFERNIYGTIELIPADILGSWMVGGREVIVTKDTVIDVAEGRPTVGSAVQVWGQPSGQGFIALQIRIHKSQ